MAVASPAPHDSRRTALVVGAGIGGLAAAVGLRKAGWQVRVFERAATPRELGFALMLAPNALEALGELGLAEAVGRQGAQPRRAEVRQPGGRLLRRLDLTGARGGAGARIVVALRQALHGALLDAVGRDAIEVNRQATTFTAEGGFVTVSFADGGSASGDLLVGADGTGSVIRRVLHPAEAAPRRSGYIAVRGVTHDAARDLDGIDAVTYLGSGVEASLARASATAVYWYMSLLETDVGAERDPRIVLERHSAGFNAQFRNISRAAEDLRLDELFDRPPLAAWARGPVTLLGDAAHPMLPHAGQGAAQALEDAVALARVLAAAGPIEPALRRYEAGRARHARRTVAMARRIARVTTTRNPIVIRLRDTALQTLPYRLLVNAFAG